MSCYVMAFIFLFLHAIWTSGQCYYVQNEGQYVVIPIPVTFSDAHIQCESRGMTLAMARNPAEQIALEDVLNGESVDGGNDVWLGLKLSDFREHADYFQWSDGGYITWTHWGPTSDEPNNLGFQKCVVVDGELHRWYTKACSDRHYFVCKCYSTEGLFTLTKGPYFTELLDSQPSQGKLQERMATSWITCAALCAVTETCDVIKVHVSGTCILYHVPDSTSLFTNLTVDWSTYTMCYI